MNPIVEKALRFTQIQEANRRHYDQVKAAQTETARYEREIEYGNPGERRRERQRVPRDVGGGEGFTSTVRRGATAKDLEAQNLQKSFVEQGIGSEQGRKISVQKEHAISIAGDPKEVPKATPLDYNIKHRGSDYYKSQFSGSGRYNVRLGPKDSFTLDQMRNIGRPVNWYEAAADHKAFGKDTMIDLTNEDWLNLQQGKVTDEQLVSHKMQVDYEGKQGNIWFDAADADEMIQDIDTVEGKGSLQRHFKKDHHPDTDKVKRPTIAEGENLKARTWKGKLRSDTENFKFSKLKIGEGIKSTGKLRTADILARLGADVTTGNVPGAFINTAALSVNLAGQNPTVQKNASKVFMEIAKMSGPAQKNIRRQIIKALGKRGAKTTAKLVPGADVAISAAEVKQYLAEGKLDQAGIAALSGAIGWIPGAGDFGAALLDFTNTAIDITRMDFSGKPEVDVNKKPEIVQHKKQKQLKGSGVLTNAAMDKTFKDLGISKEYLEGVSSSGFGSSMTMRDLLKSAKKIR